MLFNIHGHPVNMDKIKQMIKFYDEKENQSTPTTSEPAPQKDEENDGWGTLNLSGAATTTSQPLTSERPGTLFQTITAGDDIQQLGNKEVRLGETQHFYNPDAGELYRKSMDYLDGRLVLEKAIFVKEEINTPTSQSDTTLDKLNEALTKLTEIVMPLVEDMADLKGAITSATTETDS